MIAKRSPTKDKLAKRLHDAIYDRRERECADILAEHPWLSRYPLTDEGYGPLTHAAGVRLLPVVRAVLHAAGNRVAECVNDQDNITGRTALHAAAENLDYDTVRVLRGMGGDIRVTDRNGETPSELAYWQAAHAPDIARKRKETILRLGGVPKHVRESDTRPEPKGYAELGRIWQEEQARISQLGK